MSIMSQKDPNIIVRTEHDEDLDAKRVTIVGGDMDIKVDLDSDRLSEALKGAIESLEIPQPVVTLPEIKVPQIDVKVPEMDLKVIEVEKIITIPEIKIVEVEKQVIIKEETIKTIEIEKPIYIKETEVVMVDKPIVTEVVKERIPSWVYSVFVVQFLLLVGAIYKLYMVMG